MNVSRLQNHINCSHLFGKCSPTVSINSNLHKIYSFVTMVHCYNYHTVPIILSFIQSNFSEIGFSFRLKVEPTQMGPTERASLCLRTGMQAPPKDGNKIQSSKCCNIDKTQDDG
jgi:hypothetical protein